MLQTSWSRFAKMFLFTLVIFAILAPSANTSASGNGKWVPTTGCPSMNGGAGCLQGTTCSEWDVDGEESTMTCCIPLPKLGSSDLNVCQNS